jgi:DNA-binding transcriptional LysR family regulator
MPDRFRTARIDWEDVRFFAALARYGSLSAAARALTVNHATVARRLAALEQTLGTRLFKRRPTGYELTAAGRSALEAAGAMENAAAALSRLEHEMPLTGLVRITATPSLAEIFLIPRLAALQHQYPGLDLEVMAERRPVSLQRHQSDIALRLGRPERSELLGRCVGRIAYRFYAAPVWRDRLKEASRHFLSVSTREAPIFPRRCGSPSGFATHGLPSAATTRSVRLRRRAPAAASRCSRAFSRPVTPPWSSYAYPKSRPLATYGC